MFDVSRTVDLIKGMLLAPRPTWQAYLPESRGWKQTAKDLTLPLLVGALTFSYILSFLFPASNLAIAGLGLGGLVFGVIGGFVWMVVSAFIFAFMAGVFGGRKDFDKSFAALSLTSVPAYAGMLADVLPLIGWALALGLTIYSIVLSYQIMPDALGVPQGKRIVHFIVSILVGFVALLLTGFMMLQIFGPLLLIG